MFFVLPSQAFEFEICLLEVVFSTFSPPSGVFLPTLSPQASRPGRTTSLARRVIACLDVRCNDAGDVVVTKGDQYDVREEGNGAFPLHPSSNI